MIGERIRDKVAASRGVMCNTPTIKLHGPVVYDRLSDRIADSHHSGSDMPPPGASASTLSNARNRLGHSEDHNGLVSLGFAMSALRPLMHQSGAIADMPALRARVISGLAHQSLECPRHPDEPTSSARC